MAEKKLVAITREGKLLVDMLRFPDPQCPHKKLQTVFVGHPQTASYEIIDVCMECHVIDPFHKKDIVILATNSFARS